MIKIGLVGYGKAGSAVAQILKADPRFDLRWIARRTATTEAQTLDASAIPAVGLDAVNFSDWLDELPVDAIVDFSAPQALQVYGEELRRRKIMLVSAISAYDEEQLSYARSLGQDTRVLCSPNITLGINFLIMAAKLLRSIAPFADVEILEQHFKEKPEVSGTAKKIAESLELGAEKITSLRLGGIVGHHEVIFGFPYQTVRLTHDSIKREAFGTGAAFALSVLRRFRVVFSAVRTHFRQMEKQVGLGGAQVWALSVIKANPGIGMGGVATRMDIHQSTASNLVKALLRKELISMVKAPEDRRHVQLNILPVGTRLLKKVPGPFEGVLPDALGNLSAETLHRLDADLAQLIGLLNADETAAGTPLAQI